LSPQTLPKEREKKKKKKETMKLVDSFFLVGIRKKEKPGKPGDLYEPFVKQCFPEMQSKEASRVPLFCFPEDITDVVNSKDS
jgi:hypothetical protein